jgi:hypothetical protein
MFSSLLMLAGGVLQQDDCQRKRAGLDRADPVLSTSDFITLATWRHEPVC